METKKTKKTTVTTTTEEHREGSVTRGQKSSAARSTQSSAHEESPASEAGTSKTTASPTKFSRLFEKEELQNLNDRLASYIDRVLYLESENNQLIVKVRTADETTTREVATVKTLFEDELSQVRRLLDDLSKDKAKLQIENQRLINDNEELRVTNLSLSRETNDLKSKLAAREIECNDNAQKLKQMQIECKRYLDDSRSFERERNKLQSQYSDVRKQLEKETLERVEFENALQTLKEEFDFKEQIFQKQLVETRTRKQVEISELDGKLNQEYQEKLQESLQDMRDDFESEFQLNKEEMRHMYEEKIKMLINQADRQADSAAAAINELKLMERRLKDINTKISLLESENNILNQKLRDMDELRNQEKTRSINESNALVEELVRLREEMAKQASEYQDLIDTKVTLDMEIMAYRKLLEAEEERLNITPSPSRTPRQSRSSSSRQPASKRKRMFYEEEEDYSFNKTSKEIEIKEVSNDGKFIKIANISNKDIAIGGWQLKQIAGDKSTVYTFHRTVKLTPGAISTIWSSDCVDQTHKSPENLVMKSQQWIAGDRTSTQLLDMSGQEMATSELSRIFHSTMRQRDIGGGSSYASRRLVPRLESQGGSGEEKCSIM